MDFSVQINKFKTLGEYDYKFDEVGNVIVNSSSAEFSYNYLSLPLLDFYYDNKAVESYYDVNFTEFIPVKTNVSPVVNTEEIQQNNQQLLEENTKLKQKIEEFVQLSETDSSISENEAVKRVILDLRMELKQGESDKDFSTDFPYTPISSE